MKVEEIRGPRIIDAEWEPSQDSPPRAPMTFVEAIADDAQRITKSANVILDELSALQAQSRNVAASVRGLVQRISRGVELRVGGRKPLGR